MEKEAYILKYFLQMTGAGIFLETHNELGDEGRPFSIGNIVYEDKE
jgi:hypothetical protein